MLCLIIFLQDSSPTWYEYLILAIYLLISVMAIWSHIHTMVTPPGYVDFDYTEYQEDQMHAADLSLYKFVTLHKESRASN